MNYFGDNCAEVRGNACRIPAAGHKEKGKGDEGQVGAAGDGKDNSLGSGDTANP